jgi:hypothetical protein
LVQEGKQPPLHIRHGGCIPLYIFLAAPIEEAGRSLPLTLDAGLSLPLTLDAGLSLPLTLDAGLSLPFFSSTS